MNPARAGFILYLVDLMISEMRNFSQGIADCELTVGGIMGARGLPNSGTILVIQNIGIC